MAATGFGPVKNRLKEVIDYARNPDKTTDKKFLDEDLYAALRYVEDDKKTDQTICFGDQLSETKSIRIYDGY